jgi:hypothetical protein
MLGVQETLTGSPKGRAVWVTYLLHCMDAMQFDTVFRTAIASLNDLHITNGFCCFDQLSELGFTMWGKAESRRRRRNMKRKEIGWSFTKREDFIYWLGCPCFCRKWNTIPTRTKHISSTSHPYIQECSMPYTKGFG